MQQYDYNSLWDDPLGYRNLSAIAGATQRRGEKTRSTKRKRTKGKEKKHTTRKKEMSNKGFKIKKKGNDKYMLVINSNIGNTNTKKKKEKLNEYL